MDYTFKLRSFAFPIDHFIIFTVFESEISPMLAPTPGPTHGFDDSYNTIQRRELEVVRLTAHSRDHVAE
jgi:hypothetical protein